MLMVTLVLTYGSYLHFWRAYDIGDSSLDINLPTWPAKLSRLILQTWGYARAIKEGGDQPVAVPLIENAATVATSAVFARIAVPEMLKLGYDKRFAAGVVAAGGNVHQTILPLHLPGTSLH
jgi:hypothetical protein